MNLRSTPNLWFRYLLTWISPRLNIRFFFKRCHGKYPDLKNPKTLDEKIQWMKLHYYKDNALVCQCADKYRVREYVRDCGLEHILNELYATYRSAADIPWEQLPDQFVPSGGHQRDTRTITILSQKNHGQKSRILL